MVLCPPWKPRRASVPQEAGASEECAGRFQPARVLLRGVVVRMKRPQGYKTIKCPHCGEKVKLHFRTLHRLKLEVGKGDSRG